MKSEGLTHLVSITIEQWHDRLGSKYSCTHYFERYLLAKIKNPVVLALDDLDLLFQYPKIATHFLGLLRAWYEKSKYGDDNSNVWQKLRLVVIHTTEMIAPLNSGLSVKLSGFAQMQVVHLAQQYQLNLSVEQANQLIQLVDGNPYLVRLTLNSISQEKTTFDKIMQNAIN